jgi:hypothetical protein
VLVRCSNAKRPVYSLLRVLVLLMDRNRADRTPELVSFYRLGTGV